LRALAGDVAEQERRLDNLEPALEKWFDQLRNTMSRPGGNIRPAAERPVRDDNQLTLDGVRRLLTAIRDDELLLLAEQARQSEAAVAWLGRANALAILLALAMAAGSAGVMNRSAARRFQAEDALRRREEADGLRAQETLRRSHDQLEVALVQSEEARRASAELARADATARKALEAEVRRAQKLEAVGRLAGGIAHDFNNLLTVINGCCDLLLLRFPTSDPARELLDAVHGAGERAAGLTRQLLAFGRRQIVQPHVLDLNVIVADLVKLLARLIGEDITLELHCDSAAAFVCGDRGQLEQIVMNLALNARDAMPQGGRLQIGIRHVELDESYAATHLEVQAGPYVLLSVRDTGAGMDETMRAHLFEPFFTTKGPGKGTGLGLATVYTVVKQMGGDIGFDSAPGEGTTVRIYLPRTDQGKADALPMQGSSAAAGGAETVLLVEDEPGVRKLVGEVLRSRGYTVLDAGDGVEALRVAGGYEGPIDLLVTDVVMPHLSGRALGEHLTALRPALKVLYLSGHTDEAVLRHGVHARAAFLQKPFTPDALAAKVRAVLTGT
jgi:signal transduction histidine kinase